MVQTPLLNLYQESPVFSPYIFFHAFPLKILALLYWVHTAKSLLEDRFCTDAVSRAYYSMLHVARAILLTKEIEPTSHEGLLTMFSLHFIKEGLIEDEFGKLLKRAKDEREEGDYEVTVSFSREEAEKRISEAESFADRIKRYLMENGYY